MSQITQRVQAEAESYIRRSAQEWAASAPAECEFGLHVDQPWRMLADGERPRGR